MPSQRLACWGKKRSLPPVDQHLAADNEVEPLAQKDQPEGELDAPDDRRGEESRREVDEAAGPEHEHHRAEEHAGGGDDRDADQRRAGDGDGGHGLERLHGHRQPVEKTGENVEEPEGQQHCRGAQPVDQNHRHDDWQERAQIAKGTGQFKPVEPRATTLGGSHRADLVHPAAGPGASSTCRSRAASDQGLKGFWRNTVPGAPSPWLHDHVVHDSCKVQHPQVRTRCDEPTVQLTAAETGHHHVGQQQVDVAREIRCNFERIATLAGLENLIAQIAQDLPHDDPHRVVVLREEDRLGAARQVKGFVGSKGRGGPSLTAGSRCAH